MSVKKDNNGTYYVSYRKKRLDGTSYPTTERGFRTKKEALEWEDAHKTANTSDKALGAVFEQYIAEKEVDLKERTLLLKKDIYKRFIDPYFKNRKLYTITPSEISEWQLEISKRGYSESYMRTVAKEFKAIYTHAEKYYDLSTRDNPFRKVKLIGSYRGKNLNFWTEKEFNSFISGMEYADKYHVLFNLLFYTGMRIGEALALTTEKIDFEKHQITINTTYCRKEMKDYITSTKTENSERVIDIPKFLTKELQDYLNRFYGGLEEDERIFNIVHEAVQHKLKREAEKAGVKKIRVHDLRHSHAAYLINKGVDPLILQERLGHSDIKMTLGVYGHIYPSRQKEVMKMIEEEHKNENN